MDNYLGDKKYYVLRKEKVRLMNYNYKITLLGDENVGKTSLLLRYIKDVFQENYKPTLGASFIEKIYSSEELEYLKEDNSVRITFWDMAGQLHFESVVKIYLENSHGIVMVYDLSNSKTLVSIHKWIRYIEIHHPTSNIIILGNKKDLIQAFDLESNKMKIKEENIYAPFFVSAKTAENVDDGFRFLIDKIFQKFN